MTLVDAYLDALQRADADAVVALFAPDGVVHSPLYGVLPAREFYPGLFADTGGATLTLRRVLRDGEGAIAFWFDFDWVLADGTSAPFRVIDLAELDDDGRITALHIVYDTHPIRADFDRATGRAAAAG